VAFFVSIMQNLSPFHIAIPVADLELCRTFYRDYLGCTEGRSDTHWVDFNFFGHQLVIHQKEGFQPRENVSNEVDGKDVPIPHFGVLLEWSEWEQLSKKLVIAHQKFVIEPYIRFKGEVGEQATMFFLDPENNALEFKAFKDTSQIFAK
jgi:extradiol dioxygenase family protein